MQGSKRLQLREQRAYHQSGAVHVRTKVTAEMFRIPLVSALTIENWIKRDAEDEDMSHDLVLNNAPTLVSLLALC